MQFAGRKPPLGVIYDSDFASSIDSVLALALLHGFQGKNESRIAGLTISNPDLQAAQLCDVIEKFYASATTGIAAVFFTSMAVGLSEGKPGALEIASTVLAKKDDGGKPVYSPHVNTLNDTAVPEVLIRNALSAQYDGNAAIILAGPSSNLLRLLDLPGSKDLVKAKVKVLVAVGNVGDRLAAGWPTPMIMVGEEVGRAIPYPGASIEKDFAYNPNHPIADAYRASHAMPYDAPAPSMAAVLQTVRAKEQYFQLSPPDTHNIQRLTVDPSQKERIQAVYTQMASAKPVPRTFRRPVVVDKADEKGVQ